MQSGFAMLEGGSVRAMNRNNIIFKNLMDMAIGSVVFWLIGYGFAYGDDQDHWWIGSANFALSQEDGSTYAAFFFQFTFAATAAVSLSSSYHSCSSCCPYPHFSSPSTLPPSLPHHFKILIFGFCRQLSAVLWPSVARSRRTSLIQLHYRDSFTL